MTTYNPAKVERLIAEVREDVARMLVAFREFGDSHLIRTKHGSYGTHAVAVVLERLAAMADQLEAARTEIVRLRSECNDAADRDAEIYRLRADVLRLTESARAAAENWMGACRQRDELRAEVARLNAAIDHLTAQVDQTDPNDPIGVALTRAGITRSPGPEPTYGQLVAEIARLGSLLFTSETARHFAETRTDARTNVIDQRRSHQVEAERILGMVPKSGGYSPAEVVAVIREVVAERDELRRRAQL